MFVDKVRSMMPKSEFEKSIYLIKQEVIMAARSGNSKIVLDVTGYQRINEITNYFTDEGFNISVDVVDFKGVYITIQW